jgi:hypothetical protein
MARDKEPVLARWSRRKLDETRAPEAQAPAPADAAQPPDLPPIDQLGFDSDYRGFLHPKVDEVLRRQALKKLFQSAHFSQPDMMDDFNQDYTLLENLTPEAAGQLAHVKRTLLNGQPEPQAPQDAPQEKEPAAQEIARADAAQPNPNPNPNQQPGDDAQPDQEPDKTNGAAG